MAQALDEVYKRLLDAGIIDTHGYDGKLPRSVTVSRLGHQPRKKKGTSPST
jgi:hypothetical protein